MGKHKILLDEQTLVLSENAPTALTGTIKVLTWNVMAADYSRVDFDHHQRIQQQLQFISEQQADLVLLQEVDSTFLEHLQTHDLSTHYHLHITDLNPYGQVTLAKVEINRIIYRFSKQGDKKILIIGDHHYQWINCHLRAGYRGLAERTGQVKKIIDQMIDSKKTVFLAGDLNMISEEETVSGWFDLAEEKTYTFDPERNPLAAHVRYPGRFDRIYCNRPVTATSTVLDKIVLSDHYPLFVKLTL